jgi:hypothetical protein
MVHSFSESIKCTLEGLHPFKIIKTWRILLFVVFSLLFTEILSACRTIVNQYSEGDIVGVVWLASGDFIEVRENFVITKWNSSYVQQWKRTVVVNAELLTGVHPVDNNNIKIISYANMWNFDLTTFAETDQGKMPNAKKWNRVDRYILHYKDGFIYSSLILKILKILGSIYPLILKNLKKTAFKTFTTRAQQSYRA